MIQFFLYNLFYNDQIFILKITILHYSSLTFRVINCFVLNLICLQYLIDMNQNHMTKKIKMEKKIDVIIVCPHCDIVSFASVVPCGMGGKSKDLCIYTIYVFTKK